MTYRLCYVSDAALWPTRDGFYAEANWPIRELAGELASCAEVVVVGRTIDEPSPSSAQFIPRESGGAAIRAAAFRVPRRGATGYVAGVRQMARVLAREYAHSDVIYLKPSVAALVGQRFVEPRHLVVTHLMGNAADALARRSMAGTLAMPVVRRATKMLFRHATLRVSVSSALARAIDAGLPECMLVNESRLRPWHIASPGAAARPYTLAYVGRLSPEKGVEIIPDILDRYVDQRLLVLGDGPMKPALVAALERRRLLGRVDFRCPVPWGDPLFEWLDRIEVVLMPSYSEGFGLAAVEALARGGKVVAARVGGLAENLDGLDRVRLVATRSVQEWVAAIEELRTADEPQPDIRRFLFDENMKVLAAEIERRFRRADAA
jgi:glycosyltransferase involved in cell wall biosynthesis